MGEKREWVLGDGVFRSPNSFLGVIFVSALTEKTSEQEPVDAWQWASLSHLTYFL